MPGENTVFCGIDNFLSFGRAGCRPTPSKSPTREYAHVFAWYYSVLQLARLGNWFESNLPPSSPPGIDSQTAQRCGLRPTWRRVGRTVRLPRTMATSHDHLQRTIATAHGDRGPTVRLQRMIATARCGCGAAAAHDRPHRGMARPRSATACGCDTAALGKVLAAAWAQSIMWLADVVCHTAGTV